MTTAVLTIHVVFRDPRFDHRPLIVGALLPDLLDAPFGGARWFHSVTVAVGLLAVAMAVTIGDRRRRKLLLAVPIGVLLHIVFDGAFGDTDVFWWPFTGGFDDAPLPVIERRWWSVVLELIGIALAVWCVRRSTSPTRDGRAGQQRCARRFARTEGADGPPW